MEITNQEIINRYKQLLADANHQIICYKLAVEKLEQQNANLQRTVQQATEDPSKVSYTHNHEEAGTETEQD